MKTATFTFALIAATGFALAPTGLRAQDAPPPPADYNAPPPDGSAPPPDASGGDDQGQSFQNFYDQLGSQGQWIQTDDYGYVFQPTVQDPDWAPYTDGHWVYTAYGWTWVSDEPWGWATYHYGRWVNLDGTGWCWVPGYTWAPAWVSWRYGGGYAGWAPLPPATLIGVDFATPGLDIGIGFHFGSDCDERYGIGAGCYHFLPDSYIGERNYRNYYLDRSRNYTVINRTTNITNVTYNNTTVNNYGGGAGAFGRVHANGPSLTEINGHARTPVQQVRLATSAQPGRSTLEGGTLNVYAPRVNPATVHQARPTAVAQTLSHVKVNRGTSITHPLQTTAQFKPVAPTAEAITAARQAQAEAPRTAHIATANTKPEVTLSKPITQLQPVAQEHRAIAPRPAPQPTPGEIGGQTHNTYEPQHNAAPEVSHTTAPNTANLQQEAQARAQQEAQARAQQEAQARAQQEAQARSQQETEEQEAQARSQQETEARAQQQAQAREEAQAQAREQQQAQAREEAQARAQEQAQARAQEQAQARAEAQAQARAEAQAQARAQAQGQKNKNGQQGQ